MIKLCDSAITIINPDGTRFVFELDELQSRIIKSCLAAGIRDVWIAEDISLSIEYALIQDKDASRVFTLADINYIVVKILEETGYPEVAEKFRLQNDLEDETVKVSNDIVVDIIKNNLGLVGKALENVAQETKDALTSLNAADVSPALIIELAKHYKNKSSAVNEMRNISVTGSAEGESWRVPVNEIMARLETDTKPFFDSGVLQVAGVSPLYPAVKIDLMITKFASQLGLESPLTEMAVIPHFFSLAHHINVTVAAVDQLFDDITRGTEAARTEPLPIYINVRDMSVFAKDWMHSLWPDAHECCEDMLYYLERDLERGVFKLQLS